tara:strand:+ start:1511 stop:2182 length:672 start_codon:yes stop_codon:yes gene_type:complete
MAYVDISSLKSAMKRSLLWNINKPAIVSFRRKDYHGDPTIELDSAVRKTLLDKTGKQFKGPIRLLTHLRYFGHCFNPVSFYYCFDENDKKVEAILAEVTNTPWKERHTYVIDEKLEADQKISFTATPKKQFHVSPFWGMDHDYEWFFSNPDEALNVIMKNYKDGQKVFNVALSLKRRDFNKKGLIKAVLRFPLATFVVVYRIHLQALMLLIRRAPFFTHPDKL